MFKKGRMMGFARFLIALPVTVMLALPAAAGLREANEAAGAGFREGELNA